MLSRLFVYGTLRPGTSRHVEMLAAVTVATQPATLTDHALYGRGMPYPFVRPHPGGFVVGDLVEIAAATIESTLWMLDEYEGGEYRRETVAIAGADAWIYLAVVGVALSPDQILSSGDWLAEHEDMP